MNPDTEKTDFFKISCGKEKKKSAYIDAEGRLLPCMGFADSPLADKFANLLSEDWRKASWDSLYSKVADTTIQQMVDANPHCRDCEYLRQCIGGCMAAGITPDGSWLHFDPQRCWFYMNVGEQAVRDIATPPRSICLAVFIKPRCSTWMTARTLDHGESAKRFCCTGISVPLL